ncbi:MAG: hypothetical protein IPM57_03395 [Oligoflexia bacterium]|nr:hypothetical protein [Oligoflexia bacterium]
MQDILLGGDLEKIESERSLFEKNDVRKNLFDLSIGSFYFYNHSQSTYYYRNYLSASPGAFVNLDLWVTPYLGFNSNYKFTLLNSIKDSPTAETYTTANHDWLSFGLKFRRFFGSAFENTSFSIDLNYIDKKLDIPLSSTHRVKTRSRGPQVSFNLITPSSKYFLWDFAINIQPFVLHEEFVGTSDLRSGTNNQTLGFGASIGGEYRMSRKLRTFFKFSAELYRSQFSGNALATDPINSSIPSNVVINDAYYFFNIGLIFGR